MSEKIKDSEQARLTTGRVLREYPKYKQRGKAFDSGELFKKGLILTGSNIELVMPPRRNR